MGLWGVDGRKSTCANSMSGARVRKGSEERVAKRIVGGEEMSCWIWFVREVKVGESEREEGEVKVGQWVVIWMANGSWILEPMVK